MILCGGARRAGGRWRACHRRRRRCGAGTTRSRGTPDYRKGEANHSRPKRLERERCVRGVGQGKGEGREKGVKTATEGKFLVIRDGE